MSATHDYHTISKKAHALNNKDILVGESGGLSAVYSISYLNDDDIMSVQTEHGTIVCTTHWMFDVLDLQ